MNNNICTFFIKTTGKNTFFAIYKDSITLLNKKVNNNNLLLKLSSCGHFGFKGRKKETPFACSVIANKNTLFALNYGFKYVHIIFNGVSLYKKFILNNIIKTYLNNKALQVLSITDTTQIPHNGCRIKKLKKR